MKRLIVPGVLIALIAALSFGGVNADGPNRAGLLVVSGDSVTATCVGFDELEITGLDLLDRSGLAVVQQGSGLGTAVCSIEGVGCADANDCWCQCRGSSCSYWAYFTLEGGAWRYSAVGASQRKVHDGDVDAWVWGSGGIGAANAPPATSFEEICPPEVAPEPTSTPVPASTGEESPTAGPSVAEPLVTATATPVSVSTGITVTEPSRTPTRTPLGLNRGVTAEESSGSGFPWQFPAFGVLAAGLLAVAVALGMRRSHG